MSKYWEKMEEHKKLDRRRAIKRNLKSFAVLVLVTGILIFAVWYVVKTPGVPEESIISRIGIHWHPELAISIKGEKAEIPANIGIGAVHNPIHTHDATGVIHLEFPGIVMEKNLRLGNFFDIWGRKFSRECIFDYCNGPDGTVKFFVNGRPNNNFEDYLMRDKDQIEIRYE